MLLERLAAASIEMNLFALRNSEKNSPRVFVLTDDINDVTFGLSIFGIERVSGCVA